MGSFYPIFLTAKLQDLQGNGSKWLLLLLLIISGYGCGREAQEQRQDTFYWNMHGGVTSLDPAFARAQFNIWACNQLYNGLIQLDDQLVPQPAIAHRWEISDSGKVYTFFLRPEVRFHPHPLLGEEGRPVVAADFAYSFARLIDPELASPGAWIFNDKVAGPESFVAVNDSTFQIRLLRPFPPLLGLLSMQYCSVVPPEVVEHYGEDFREHPVGTGPFQLGYWEEEARLVLRKNPLYWEWEDGQRLPYLEAVSISFMPNRQNEFFAFLDGDLDMVNGIDPGFADHLLTPLGELQEEFEGEFRLETLPYLNTEYMGILMDEESELMRDNPLRLQKVRQAINYGFDRTKMMRYLRYSLGTPGIYGMVPPGIPSFDSANVQGYDYNPQRALQLLEEAGYPRGEGLPEITLSTNPTYLDLAVFMERQLEDLGIPIRLETNPPSQHRQYMAEQKMAFFRGSWIADYPDAENYLTLFYGPYQAPAGPNYTHFQSARFDSLYRQSLLTTHDSARAALYLQMENLVMEQAPVVVLYYDEVVRLVQNYVTGLNRNPINLVTLKRVRKF